MTTEYKRLLSIQDISCIGQCSLTAALPIISVCGIECAILPSAVLSTHTGGFTGFTFRDLSDDMLKINNHWLKEKMYFDTIYTGYLGSTKQINYVKEIINTTGKKDCLKIVDPAMGDNGKLYHGFDEGFVKRMADLCTVADYVLPNITEACYITDTPYKETYTEDYIDELLEKLTKKGCKNIILTGVSYDKDKTGVVIYEDKSYSYYEHTRVPGMCHGTGDIYASVFAGAMTRGKTSIQAAKIAADFTYRCVVNTQNYPNHIYGAVFEPLLNELIDMLK